MKRVTFDKGSIFTADFETINDAEAISNKKTAVYAWAVCNIEDIDTVECGWDIDSFFDWCMRREKNTCVYFHNMKHDGRFLEHCFTVTNGMKHVSPDALREDTFTSCISGQGRYYFVRILSANGAVVEFRDSTNKVPGTVAKIGEDFQTKYRKLDGYDYSEKKRVPGTPLTGNELEYLKNDVRVMAEVIKFMYDEGMTKMTIGSDCMAYFKRMVNEKNKNKFRLRWPDLHGYKRMIGEEWGYFRQAPVPRDLWANQDVPETEHEFVRRAYRGGFCYANRKYKRKLIKRFAKKYDVCSLYPSMMHSGEYRLRDGKTYRNAYPYGKGKYFKGGYVEDSYYPLYFICFDASFKLRDGYCPTVQLKNMPGYKGNEYVEDSRNVKKGKGDGIVRLVMTSVDYEIFLEHYECDYLCEIGGYKYKAAYGFFDKYIEEFFAKKSTSKGARKQLYKLFLNNLYGKMAQSIISEGKYAELCEDGRNHYRAVRGGDREPVYMPVGAYITAYARRFTIDAIQANWDKFVYGDTDSMILLLDLDENPKGVKVGNSKLQTWELEAIMDEVKVVRQKTYMEHDIGDDKGMFGEGVYKVKCAGLPAEGRDYLIKLMVDGSYSADDFKNGLRLPKDFHPRKGDQRGGEIDWNAFDVGLELPKGVKLRPMLCYGGQLLVPTNFKIRGEELEMELTDEELSGILE